MIIRKGKNKEKEVRKLLKTGVLTIPPLINTEPGDQMWLESVWSAARREGPCWQDSDLQKLCLCVCVAGGRYLQNNHS